MLHESITTRRQRVRPAARIARASPASVRSKPMEYRRHPIDDEPAVTMRAVLRVLALAATLVAASVAFAMLLA